MGNAGANLQNIEYVEIWKTKSEFRNRLQKRSLTRFLFSPL
ncbi:hypothetical protein LEP1GSC193_4015 [Leptospira alstonii serovar Pingchang str. 80-412]|uniref:Uncharacterized protein n=2 Tax=Leptospira alstonii TaxID=28452 RepID=M6D1G9_9LEPT|nr:hypothetical protein LEP1GSC194_1586 [Leptospira alstonii serovar Sichuan str. 79601]EQA81576.1 hypothetical protein LEP1GSC193_4015 [Leptospira alstonii serovar Pingchang str. 80-412]